MYCVYYEGLFLGNIMDVKCFYYEFVYKMKFNNLAQNLTVQLIRIIFNQF